jgi:protein tyrosine/serine phosphatase
MCAGPASAGPAAAIAPAVHIDNFGQINARYYRGGQPQARDYTDLAALGVKTIVNLTSDDAQAEEPALAQQNGLHYFQIPMTTHQPPTGAQLAEFLAIVNDPENQPVYVHCVGGRHRTGVMTAVYRMTDDGWTAEQAFAEMKKYQFGMDFLHPEFKKFVYEFRPAAKPSAPAVLATQVIH